MLPFSPFVVSVFFDAHNICVNRYLEIEQVFELSEVSFYTLLHLEMVSHEPSRKWGKQILQ